MIRFDSTIILLSLVYDALNLIDDDNFIIASPAPIHVGIVLIVTKLPVKHIFFVKC